MEAQTQLVARIIEEQAQIIGPLAWEEAQKVVGLHINMSTHDVSVEGDPRDVLEKLVAQYELLFGLASREVCRDAVRPFISQVSQDQIPTILR